MISTKKLEELAVLRHDALIVSAYIRLDPKLAYDRRNALTQLKGLVRRFEQSTRDKPRLEALGRERPRIERYLQSLGPTGRSVVVFACEPGNIWETFNLDVLVPGRIDVENKPSVAFLLRVVEQYPRLAVLVAQKDHGVIYTTELRTGEERARVETEVQGRHEQGGWSQSRFRRHIEYQVQTHLKEVIESLERVQRQSPFARLAIGGTDDTINDLLRILPDEMSRKVIGTFSVDFKHMSEDGILERAHAINEEFERRKEQELVERLDEEKHPGGRGVVGLDQTLRRLSEHRIDRLIVTDQPDLAGTVCTKCGHLDTRPFDHCPVCRAPGRQVDNIVDLAMEQALIDGAKIEALEGEPNEWLRRHGGVGAILRY